MFLTLQRASVIFYQAECEQTLNLIPSFILVLIVQYAFRYKSLTCHRPEVMASYQPASCAGRLLAGVDGVCENHPSSCKDPRTLLALRLTNMVHVADAYWRL